MPSTNKRRAISEKTRFEIFKRDSFTCQYCGVQPPEVILHIDHIIPVASGGTNEPENLITACQSCNSGKGARSLSQNSIIKLTSDKAEDAKSRAEQLRMIAKAYQEQQEAFKELGQFCWDRWLTYGVYVGKNDEAIIRNLAKQYPLPAILDGMDFVVKKNQGRHQPCMKYLHSSIRMFMEPQEKREARFIRRTLENRFSIALANEWVDSIKAYILCAGLDRVKSHSTSCATIDEFESEMDRFF